MLYSNYKPLIHVNLPPPILGRQFYMHTFKLADPSVPAGFEDYLDPVQKLVAAVGLLDGEAHLTIDEKIVKAGMSQRRPGPHVDGCFIPRLSNWSHGGSSGWLHYCNHLPSEAIQRMPVVIAASWRGCRAWRGIFEGTPKPDGDLTHISDQLDKGEVLQPNCGYLLSPDCVHESMIFDEDTPRTFLRIALPNTFKPNF